MRLPKLLALLAPWLLLALPAAAQSGSLEVVVLESGTGNPLPGATVSLTSALGMSPPIAVLADAEGRAVFPVVRAGTGYAVEVAMPGYATQRANDVRVRPGESEVLQVRLSPAVEERVEVRARRDVVDLEQQGAATRFSDRFIEDLPVPGRFYQNLLRLAPGVNDADEDGNPNVHGARTRDFRAQVSGVTNVDPLTGQWLSFVHPDSIAELEILTAGAGVEFGRAQGGFARILQKQGTNRFEGAFSFHYRTAELDRDGAAYVRPSLIPDFDWKQTSGQLSGPIVKDRLWYRLSYEKIDADEPLNLFGQLDLTTRDQRTEAHQLTWQASPSHKFALQYQASPVTYGKLGLSSTVPAESTHTLEREGGTWSLTWTAARSARLLVDSMVAYQDFGESVAPTRRFVQQDCVFFDFWFYSLNASNCLSAVDGRTSGPFSETASDDRQRLTARSDVTFYVPRFLGASHRLKLGFVVENERYARDLSRAPNMNFRVERQLIDPCPTGGTNPCWQDVGIATVRGSVPRDSSGRALGTSWGFYAEDQVKPRSNLAITLGVRIDGEQIESIGNEPFDPRVEAAEYERLLAAGYPAATAFQQAFTRFPGIGQFHLDVARALRISTSRLTLGTIATQSQFWEREQRLGNIAIEHAHVSPRLHVAWDPWGDGKTKLWLSAGRYYDKIFLAVPLVEVEPVSTNLVFTALHLFTPYFFADSLFSGITPSASVQMVDRDLRTPYQDEFTAGFERSVGTESSIKLSYIRRRFRDQLQDVDINHYTGDLGRCRAIERLGHPTVVPAPGSGDILIDPYTGETYTDTDPGPGDGRIDDCTGNVRLLSYRPFQFPPQTDTTAEPDGLADLYVLNPGWGEVLLVGNFDESRYHAIVLEFVRRLYRGWELNSSYTWSEAEGDAEDFGLRLGNERNLRENERGYLDYDQRHIVRVTATKLLPRGFRAGAALRWESGLPFSELESKLTVFSVPPSYQDLGDIDARFRLRYPSGQRNDQRNPSFWTLDLRLAKELRLPRDVAVQVSAEMFNVFNDDTPRILERIDGTNSGLARFGRRYQLGLRVSF